MTAPLGSIRSLRSALANNLTQPTRLAEAALAHSNSNPSHNTYLWQSPPWTRAESERAEAIPRSEDGAFGDGREILWGLPIAVKDCFDLAGAPTSCGTTFYQQKNGIATRDSWIVERLRAHGAVLTGKTHLHPLAYGITGENPEFGDCLQPNRQNALTGGSSSGSAASVMEGSAVAAIGTDTGGSIRVPAALCGLAGYRASLGRGNWSGGLHLAESFDTLGWLFADLEEAPLLGSFFMDQAPVTIRNFGRFAVVSDDFLVDCEPEIVASYGRTIRELESLGLRAYDLDVRWWSEALEIYRQIQAWEAATLHSGNFGAFDASLRDRLEWGARISPNQIADARGQHDAFKARMDGVFAEHELVMLPACPVAQLTAGADHTNTRSRLLRYTTPFSLAGVPTVTIPCSTGGMQLAAARENDEALLQLAALVGAHRKSSAPVLHS